MLPQPLHPAIVHFPIVLAVALPIVAITALVLIRRGEEPMRVWLPVLLVAVALAGSAWIAVQTGAREEDAVEDVVSRSAIHEHEEAAEVFMPLTFAMLALVGTGLLSNRIGKVARPVAGVAAVVLLGLGFQVGRSGGELVYEHGAASAYLTGSERSDDGRERDGRERDEESRDEDDRH